jgi:hypothetical protein
VIGLHGSGSGAVPIPVHRTARSSLVLLVLALAVSVGMRVLSVLQVLLMVAVIAVWPVRSAAVAIVDSVAIVPAVSAVLGSHVSLTAHTVTVPAEWPALLAVHFGQRVEVLQLRSAEVTLVPTTATALEAAPAATATAIARVAK